MKYIYLCMAVALATLLPFAEFALPVISRMSPLLVLGLGLVGYYFGWEPAGSGQEPAPAKTKAAHGVTSEARAEQG